MSQDIEIDIRIKQASDFRIRVTPSIDGQSLVSLTGARYIIFDRTKNILVDKTLGSGISFDNGTVTIVLADQDTNIPAANNYRHECVVRDELGNDIFILIGRVSIRETTARIDNE